MKIHLPTLNQFASLIVLNITNALFQLLVIPILVHNTDTSKLGVYFLALSFGALLSIFVNFGTMQTSMVAIKKAETEREQKKILAETLGLRFFPAIVSIIICCFMPFFAKNYGLYFLMTLPMIIAEFINPQFYLIATYKIKNYTILNFLLRVSLLAAIYFYSNHPALIEITILATGLLMFGVNAVYLPSTFFQDGVAANYPSIKKIETLVRKNALVLGNGLTVHLQQSLFLFALPAFVTPLFLSAYGFIDKLISSFRMLVNAYGAAVMPHATGVHKLGYEQWTRLKKQQNILLSIFCLTAGLTMYFFPDILLTIILLGKQGDVKFFSQTVQLMKLISAVPLLISLNILNVTEVFLEEKYLAYFGAGILLLIITVLSIDALKLGLPFQYAGYYPMLIEGSSLIISFLIVQQIRNAKK